MKIADPHFILQSLNLLPQSLVKRLILSDEINELRQEVEKVKQAIDNIKELLPPEQAEVALTPLHEKLATLTAKLDGSALAIGEGCTAVGEQGTNIKGDMSGNMIRGDNSTIIQEQHIHQVSETMPPAEKAGIHYLKRLQHRCNALPLAALGENATTSDEVGLEQVYIDLDTQTQVKIKDEEEREKRQLQRGQNTRPLPVLEAAQQKKRMVLLGDPGSGKSSFVRYLCAWLAANHLQGTEVIPELAGLIPFLVTLRDLAPRLARLALADKSLAKQRIALLEAVMEQWQVDLSELGATTYGEELESVLTDGKVLLIFDGLDEVAVKHRPLVHQAVQAIVTAYPIERVIVTCRIRSYSGETKLP